MNTLPQWHIHVQCIVMEDHDFADLMIQLSSIYQEYDMHIHTN